MADTAATLHVSGDGNVAVAGPLTVDTVGALARDAQRVVGAAQAARVEVDLAGVTEVDSAGLALLIGWIAAARTADVALSFRGVPERLRAIAKISEVDTLLSGPVAA
jgi:phospholipid transport system transporter-binding protein